MTLKSTLATLFTTLVLIGLAGFAHSQDAPGKAQPKRAPDPALKPIKDTPGLPRVLLIGDSISIGYTPPVRKMLEGKANVHRIPVNGGPTSRGVAELKGWLGDSKWDVIHFNFGLHDMVYMGPDGKRGVNPKQSGAKHQVSLTDYEKNLTEIATTLKATGAKLIWCNTTPVPEGTGNRVADDSTQFNEVAATVMEKAGIPINDLHSHSKAGPANTQLRANVHYSKNGSAYLAKKVAAEIEKALK